MAIDFAALKNKLNKLENVGNNSVWKPDAGENIIRIVPSAHNEDGSPFSEVFFNYEVTKKSLISPKTFGEADPIVEFAEKLKSTGQKSDWLSARKMEPKMRTFVPIVVRGKENEGVKLWGFGKTVYQELIKIFVDEDYGDISDPTKGRDIVVDYKPAADPQSFPTTSIRCKPNVTTVSTDKAIVKKIVENQPDLLKEVFTTSTYDELMTYLQNYLDGGQSTEAAPEKAEATEKAVAQTGFEETSPADVDSQFENLFKKK